MKDHGKLLVVRVDGTPINDGTHWRQGFILAAQTVRQGKQELKSVKEFCE